MTVCIKRSYGTHLVLEQSLLALPLLLLHLQMVHCLFLALDGSCSLLPLLLLLGLPNDSLALSVVDVYGRAKSEGANGLMTGLCVWGCECAEESR